MALDTQIPPWLQHNITQKNDSPWLINALEQGQRIRQRQAEFPLHLQQMQLRNQAIELEVERQGMVNEIASEDLISERREMPLVAEWVRNTKGNPMRILNDPIPQVTNQRLQKIVMDTQHMAAQNAYVQATQKYQIGLTEAAAKLVTLGQNVKPRMDENGQQYFDPEDLAEAAKTVRDEEREFILQKIGAQTAWHANVGGKSAVVATIEYRQGLKQQISAAEDLGDFATADSLRDDLAALDRSHPDLREKARMQSITSELREIERQLGDLTLKKRWPDLEQRKARLQSLLGGSDPTPVPTAAPPANDPLGIRPLLK